MPELTDQQPSPRQRNWAPWIAVLLALAAILSNAGFFVALPGQRALAWLGVVLAIAAIVCAVIGVMRAFRQPQIYGGKVSSAILGIVSLLICGLVAVTSIGSRAMPAATNAPQVGQKVPDFTLADTTGNKVSLGELLGKADTTTSAFANNSSGQTTPVGLSTATPPKAVLLVFYRGYW
jgi:ABC-type amino acid transport system permease subunit